jgi:transcriptional regulator with XRE-family HTH domain
MNRYCEAMAEKRRALGYSQSDFADYLHYSVQTIAKYERGLSEMDVSSLIYASRFLQVDIDSFLKGEDAKHNDLADTHGFDPDMFTRNLVTVRVARRMNQNKLSKLCGCSARSIKNYEGGKSLPSLTVFSSMLEALNVSAADFLFEDLSTRAEFIVTAKNKKAWVAGITLASFGVFAATLGVGTRLSQLRSAEDDSRIYATPGIAAVVADEPSKKNEGYKAPESESKEDSVAVSESDLQK